MSGQTVTGAVAQRKAEIAQKQADVHTFLKDMRPEIQRALPKGMDADRITRLCFTLVRKIPGLAECSRESFAGALMTAAALGLEPGIQNQAWLVPYKAKGQQLAECTFIIGYGGYVKLFYQHPLAKRLSCEAVFEKDEFDYGLGTDPFISHKPATGDRGKPVYYYAVATLTSGAQHFVVLTADEVKTLRRGKVGPNGDIPDPQHWMERKTALRQLMKLVPQSTDMSRALQMDEVGGTELRRNYFPEVTPPSVDVETGVVEGEFTEGETPAVNAAPPVGDSSGGASSDDPPLDESLWPETAKPGGGA